MALSSNSTTRLGSRMPRLVESVRRALASLFLMKRPACSHLNFEVKGRVPVKGISPRV